MLLSIAVAHLLSVGHALTLGLSGDVNLNPVLPEQQRANFTYVWGDVLPLVQGLDIFAINHESTIADIQTTDPDIIQFEDPLLYTETYTAANVAFMAVANNHQFDFGFTGLTNSISNMEKHSIAYGGLGTSAEDVRKPTIVEREGHRTAFFTLVIDECWRWPNGSLYLDGCTCGDNAGKDPAYQCYQADESAGLWYYWGTGDEVVKDVTSVISSFSKENPDHLIVVFLHFGPNFQWQPYPEHEQLLRNVSRAGAHIVWGTSSHHIQRFEIFEDTPIIYGMGDLLFRHVPGVDDFCPLYAVPCEQFRPELGLLYVFDVSWTQNTSSSPSSLSVPRVEPTLLAYGTRHTPSQTFLVSQPQDYDWLLNTFNEMSNPYGAQMARSAARSNGEFVITRLDN